MHCKHYLLWIRATALTHVKKLICCDKVSGFNDLAESFICLHQIYASETFASVLHQHALIFDLMVHLMPNTLLPHLCVVTFQNYLYVGSWSKSSGHLSQMFSVLPHELILTLISSPVLTQNPHSRFWLKRCAFFFWRIYIPATTLRETPIVPYKQTQLSIIHAICSPYSTGIIGKRRPHFRD